MGPSGAVSQLRAVVEILVHARENMELDVWSNPEKSFRIPDIVTRRQILLCCIPTSLYAFLFIVFF
jgi:hypothetical protein